MSNQSGDRVNASEIKIFGFSIEYESYEFESFDLEVADIALVYNPILDPDCDGSVYRFEPDLDPFADLGASFYEVGSVDYQSQLDFAQKDISFMKGSLIRHGL